MRFSHTADCHLGGHRHPGLKRLSEEAFERFVTGSVGDRVDFCLIAGDLFHTALPSIDALKLAVEQLERLRAAGIPVYAIPGSHDFSPSGKTMLDVLEKAGLIVNVFQGEVLDGRLRLRFTTDARSGVKITGVPGRRGMLDRKLYEDLDRSIEEEPGEKVFLFHTALSDLGIDHFAEAQPMASLPKGFLYYAGGHVHIVRRYADAKHANVVYPGPLFPNSFSELEELGHGGYWLYDAGELVRRDLPLKRVTRIFCDAEGLSGQDANAKLQDLARGSDVSDAIALLRVEGRLSSGTPADVDLRSAVRVLEDRGAYVVLRNAARLTSEQFHEHLSHDDAQDIEAHLLEEHREQLALPFADGVALARSLMAALGQEPREGEQVYEHQERVMREALALLDRKPSA